MDEDEQIEQALDEADEAATTTQERLTAEEVFSSVWQKVLGRQEYSAKRKMQNPAWF